MAGVSKTNFLGVARRIELLGGKSSKYKVITDADRFLRCQKLDGETIYCGSPGWAGSGKSGIYRGPIFVSFCRPYGGLYKS